MLKLTDEQDAAVKAIVSGDNTVVQAGAGSGKTHTLVEAARAKKGEGRLLVYNRAAADDAKRRFPSHVRASTVHGQAWHIGRRYAEKKRIPMGAGRGAPRQYGHDIAEILGVKHPITIDDIVLKPPLQGRIIRETLDRWCQGVDPEIEPEHVPRQNGLSDKANEYLAGVITPLARRAWSDVMDLRNGRINVQHDYYLRMWWDKGAVMRTDFIMLDEAQDANVLAKHIILKQKNAQLIAVGDSAQAIYQWRGTTDALESWPAKHEVYLTQSFRFGPEVAEWANMPLELIGQRMRVRGVGGPSTVGPLTRPDAVLCRTNAGAMKAAMEALDLGRRPSLAGEQSTLRDFAEAAQDLQAGKRTQHRDLFPFETWGDVQSFVETEEGADLSAMVGLIDEHGPAVLLETLGKLYSAERADVVMSTVHGAKGLEWDRVSIADDFWTPGYDANGEPRRLRADRGRLIYVALTRPRTHLDPGEGLAWLPEWIEHAREAGVAWASASLLEALN